MPAEPTHTRKPKREVPLGSSKPHSIEDWTGDLSLTSPPSVVKALGKSTGPPPPPDLIGGNAGSAKKKTLIADEDDEDQQTLSVLQRENGAVSIEMKKVNNLFITQATSLALYSTFNP